MSCKRGSILGKGINDSDEPVYWNVDGKQKRCPIYSMWCNILNRCYGDQTTINKTYEGVEIHSDWLIFSNFKSWVETQPWQGNQLDKDILGGGSRKYSPENCVFVPKRINTIFKGYYVGSKGLPFGVCVVPNVGKKKYRVHFGQKWVKNFYTIEEAHRCWQELKSEAYLDHYNWYVETESYDERVAEKILKKSDDIKLDINQ